MKPVTKHEKNSKPGTLEPGALSFLDPDPETSNRCDVFSLPVINESSHPEAFLRQGAWSHQKPSSRDINHFLLWYAHLGASNWCMSCSVQDSGELVKTWMSWSWSSLSSPSLWFRLIPRSPEAAGVPCPLQQKHCSHHASAKSKWGWTWMNTLLSGQST